MGGEQNEADARTKGKETTQGIQIITWATSSPHHLNQSR